MSDAYTFYFSDIFPDLQSFANFCDTYGVLQSGKPGVWEFMNYSYKLLSRAFWHANIRYTDPNDFCRAFANVLENRFEQYKKQKELIDKFYKLTDDEILIVRESISNISDNPNTKPDDPRKPLEYISSQSFSSLTNSKVKGYLQAINSIPSLRIDEFIRGRREYADEISFLDLFMTVLPRIDYRYDN